MRRIRDIIRAFMEPRWAAFEAQRERNRMRIELHNLREEMRAELRESEAFAEETESRCEAHEARIQELEYDLQESRQQKTIADGQIAVLSDQLLLMVHWRNAELERLKTEAAIHALKRRGGEPDIPAQDAP